jgi:uncharacterized protein (DUF362 family)/Pyruvate/2-oxoacid:ferredoxin oxidoreductase delta subunit
MGMNRVYLGYCEGYEINRVRQCLNNSFDALGGVRKFIKPGDRVLLKLNLVMKKHPDKGATSHPIFVKALVEILKSAGAQVVLGDSPGGLFTVNALKGIYRACGIEQVADETGAVLNYNTRDTVIQYKKGKVLREITIASMVKDVDKIISVSKMKTHSMTLFTGAVKNMFGVVPGVTKAEYHFAMPDIEDFSNMLVDICQAVKPDLSFMDGIIAMEGPGPTAGYPRKVGTVLASPNPYALDLVAVEILGIDPKRVPTVLQSQRRGLCPLSVEEIEIVGTSISKLKVKDFLIPETGSAELLKGRVPDFVEKFVGWVLKTKPVFSKRLCMGCGDCVNNCPAKAIVMKKGLPRVDYKKCIRCYCCQELCPSTAVTVKRPLIRRFIR